jgi:hypothetical protein
VEFVPKAELDRALEEVQRLREKNQRLQRDFRRMGRNNYPHLRSVPQARGPGGKR